ncbi:male sterility protein [Colletotrichum graminicola]|uniref:Male sterility protein n=1 Tax=Colletotrichum graminicola (strain M1.001 / M2 / FGSC 10212) TaxID=645133 RepID=E3QW60_COLGM|nr:male sterility protein [Colletotrichum graminicola M1.001]EFQ35094.1 male sterility protein [Colletotrichum graminicola M1.001]WDK10519.1 male sterility protein [Colletotrichum graminicola]
MAPIATSDLKSDLPSTMVDPSVFPSPNADKELTRLWNLHGEPHSTNFSNPSLSSIAALVRHNAATQPLQAAFISPVDNSFEVFNWSTLQNLCCEASGYYSEKLRNEIEHANQTGQQPTVALLGTGTSIDYLVTQIALNSLHIRVLLLSNKNSPATRDHLLQVCNAVAIVVDKANGASLGEGEACRLSIVDLASLADLRESSQKAPKDKIAFETTDEWNLQSMIIHSSGSTGMPKPIIHTNRSLCQIARMYRLLPEYFIENWYLCFPLFHIAGLSIVLSGIPTGLPTSLPPANWPPAPSSILSAWKALEEIGYPADCLHCAPSVIEDLYEYISLTTKDFTPLTRLKVLQPGGAPLSPAMLKKLQALGVNVKTTYGTTEIGPPLRTIPHTKDNPDVYRFRNLYPESPLVQMEPLGDGLFECVVYKGFPLAAELWLDKSAPNPYRTGDLFLQDPPGTGYFVLQGRRDDILVHSNGEKTHATALAMSLEENKTSIISKTAVFGTGKPCPSLVVEIRWDRWDKVRETSDMHLDEAVWEVVQECNEKVAAYSRIPREIILILGRDETLPVTPKGNVRRNIAWESYGDRVEDLYNRFLGDTSTTDGLDNVIPSDADISPAETIQRAVAGVLGLSQEDIAEDQDWYGLGLDSLRAVELRSKLVKVYGSFPLMFIFEYPTVKGLLGFLQNYKREGSGGEASVQDQHHAWAESTIQHMNREIDQWATLAPQSIGNSPDNGEVVYLTGASGALGNALLEVLVQLPAVKKVYCAVRGADSQARVRDSMKSRGYSEHIYQSEKIFAVDYDMKDTSLGLDGQTFELLASEVTLVMHNAWKLDFNQPIQQFENDCLRGTMNLMSFCLRGAKKKFVFMSSVAAAMGNQSGTIVPELPLGPDPANALSTGYAQSKFIVEQVTQHYASVLKMPVHILRVGQLCGHSRLGVWNHTEMWPILMMTGLDVLSAMPVLQTKVDWLPVDICAEAIQKAVFSSADESPYAVTNLVNPAPISWDELLSLLREASGLEFARVEMSEWVSLLETQTSPAGPQDHKTPALKLLSFFQEMAKGSGNGEGVVFEASKVGGGRRIDVHMVGKWLEKWQQAGLRGF